MIRLPQKADADQLPAQKIFMGKMLFTMKWINFKKDGDQQIEDVLETNFYLKLSL